VRADVIAFPDDDCYYPPDLLRRVAEMLNAHPEWDGLIGKPVDAEGHDAPGRWHSRPGALTRFNLWHRAISYAVFLRADTVRSIGSFDETLGAGADGRAGEETDYLLRGLAAGCSLHYDPSVRVHHPAVSPAPDERIEKAFAYGRATGWLLREHGLPLWFRSYVCARPLAGAVGQACRGHGVLAREHLARFRGRVSGVLSGTAGR
jgi:hypothetical protein